MPMGKLGVCRAVGSAAPHWGAHRPLPWEAMHPQPGRRQGPTHVMAREAVCVRRTHTSLTSYRVSHLTLCHTNVCAGRCCGVSSIQCGNQFESRLLHFRAASLLMYPGEQWRTAQVRWPSWETWRKILATGFRSARFQNKAGHTRLTRQTSQHTACLTHTCPRKSHLTPAFAWHTPPLKPQHLPSPHTPPLTPHTSALLTLASHPCRFLQERLLCSNSPPATPPPSHG